MKSKNMRKNRALIFIIGTVLLLIIVRSLLLHNTITAAGTPLNKAEQQALILSQEQDDEKADAGPLVAQMSVTQAENKVLNLSRSR